MKYIDAEKLIAEIELLLKRNEPYCGNAVADGQRQALYQMKDFITSIQQEQPEGNLEYWLEHFGMPKENIDNCITQIAQGYGACRYLEGVQHGAEAVNEIAKQEQSEVDLEKFDKEVTKIWGKCAADPNDSIACLHIETFNEVARHFYELGLNARKSND